jgi:hypothetical protein
VKIPQIIVGTTKRLALSGFVFVLGLIAIELIFGNWLSSDRLNKLNVIRETQFVYDVSDLYGPPGKRILYQRDKYGLRGIYGSPENIEVLTVGGSTTDQRYITEGETWQDVLKSEFSAEGRSIAMANAGIDGQTTLGHIRNFDWWYPTIPDLHPKWFLFYVGVNDFYNEDDNSELNDSGLSARIRERSALYYLYRTIRGLYRVKRAGIAHRAVDLHSVKWTDQPLQSNYRGLMNYGLRAYAERLRILASKVRALGGTPIFVTQATRRYKLREGSVWGSTETTFYGSTPVNGVDCYYMLQLLNQRTMEVCRETGSVCIDLANEVSFEDDDFYDYYHNSPNGAAKIGRYLHIKLQRII